MKVNNENVAERHYNPRLEVVKMPDDWKVFIQSIQTVKKRRKRKKKDKQDIPFKDWCMPVQPERYLKPHTYDHL